MITGEAVRQAVVIGILAFLFSLAIGFAMRRWTPRSASIKSSLLTGLMLGVSSLIVATIDLPEIRLGPPLSTILLAGVCVVAVALSVFLFRGMLRDGSRED